METGTGHQLVMTRHVCPISACACGEPYPLVIAETAPGTGIRWIVRCASCGRTVETKDRDRTLKLWEAANARLVG